MKNIKRIFLLFFLAAGLACYSQKVDTRPRCFADELLQKAIEKNPEIKKRMNDQDNEIIAYKKKHRRPKSITSPITIPVVIYIIHDGGTENISDAQIYSQMDALNNYYADAGIKFCIATKRGTTAIGTPIGGTQTVPGIIRFQSNYLTYHDLDTEQSNLVSMTGGTGNLYGTLPQNYLRIWVVKDILKNGANTNIAGYSLFPGASNSFDGAVVKASVFGNINICPTCPLLPNYNLGKTLVHEVGHYLNLHHTFNEECTEITEGTCETRGDRVCDTPPAKEYYGCAPGYNSCDEPNGEPDDTTNFMSYGGDLCTNHFTEGQKERMFAAINLYRSHLVSTDNLIFTGVCGSDNLLSASFETSNFSPCAGATVTFSPLMTAGVTYSWDFGDPASGANNFSSVANPSHTFTSAVNSPYNVTLTITNGTQTAIETNSIYVTACTPIQSTDDNWYFGTTNGLTFNTGTPVYNNSAHLNNNSFVEASAIQSNSSGQLLFYTNGIKVWNNAHAQINTANPLMGHESAHGGTLIVPKPGSTSQYYIFTKDESSKTNGFRYSIVNVTGITATMAAPAFINVAIPAPAGLGYLTGTGGALTGSEGITAIASCNGYWIITGGKKNTGYSIIVYELTAAATQLNYVGEFNGLPNLSAIAIVKASPDGNKLVYVSLESNNPNGTYLFDFDKYTGTISNKVDLNQTSSAYGASFSPDSKLLYISTMSEGYQYDLSLANPVPTVQSILDLKRWGDMQIGPDNKIYATYDPYVSPPSRKLSVIHKPNELIIGGANDCLFTKNGPIVENDLSFCLPNLINAKPGTVYTNTISTYMESCLVYRFTANVCGQSFSWNFGDPDSTSNTSNVSNPKHTFSGPGTYVVTLNGTINTTIVVGGITPVISGATTACASNGKKTYNFTTIEPGQTVKWSIVSGSGSMGLNTQSGVNITWTSLPGTIRLTVTNAAGCVTIAERTIVEYCEGDECPPNFVFEVPETATTETYNVSNSITTQANYQVVSGKNISLIAASYVMMKPDTHIKPGSTFSAKIAPCIPGRPTRDRIAMEDPLQKLTVYPNPTEGELNLLGTKIREIYLFDILGKDVFYSKYDNVNTTTIDISRLQQGIYFMKVVSDGNIIDTVKIIKD